MKARKTVLVLLATVLPLAASCSDGDSEKGSTPESADASVARDVSQGITVEDLRLKTLSEVEGILRGGGRTDLNIIPSFSSSDPKLMSASDEERKSWVVVNVCISRKNPKKITVVSYPRVDVGEDVSEQIRQGNPPYQFQQGDCQDEDYVLDLGKRP